jgi:hypothetical protein
MNNENKEPFFNKGNDTKAPLESSALGNKTKTMAVSLFVLLTLCGLVMLFTDNVLLAVIAFIVAFINSFIMYCFGHVLNVMDDNNRLLKEIAQK